MKLGQRVDVRGVPLSADDRLVPGHYAYRAALNKEQVSVLVEVTDGRVAVKFHEYSPSTPIHDIPDTAQFIRLDEEFMCKCADIHRGLADQEIRDFLSKQHEPVYRSPHSTNVEQLERQIAELQIALNKARQWEALRVIIEKMGWSVFDVSDHVSDYSRENYFSFVGTEQERDIRFSGDAWVFRNLPCTNKPLCISGKNALGGSGILEWCTDEKDAEHMLAKMRIYPQFQDLKIESAEDLVG